MQTHRSLLSCVVANFPHAGNLPSRADCLEVCPSYATRLCRALCFHGPRRRTPKRNAGYLVSHRCLLFSPALTPDQPFRQDQVRSGGIADANKLTRVRTLVTQQPIAGACDGLVLSHHARNERLALIVFRPVCPQPSPCSSSKSPLFTSHKIRWLSPYCLTQRQVGHSRAFQVSIPNPEYDGFINA